MKVNTIFSISSIKDVPTAFAFGYKGDLVTRNSTDLAKFKRVTTGHTLIMGRKTFESLGSKALPDRKMVVVSTMEVNDFEKQKDCFLARTLGEAIKVAEEEGAEEAFIIGGANLIREGIMKSDKIYYTIFNTNISGSLDPTDMVYINISILTQTKLFATSDIKEFRETCTVLGEDRNIKFKMIEVKKSAELKKEIELRSAEKKALKEDRKARKMARKLYARTKREMEMELTQ